MKRAWAHTSDLPDQHLQEGGHFPLCSAEGGKANTEQLLLQLTVRRTNDHRQPWDTCKFPLSTMVTPGSDMKVALSLTTHEAAEHGLCHTHKGSTQRMASPLGGLCPLDTSTKQRSLRLCAFQRPLSTNAAQSHFPQLTAAPCSRDRAAPSLVLKLPPIQEGTNTGQQGSTKELIATRHCCNILISFCKSTGL